jgi:hypothetical protein
MAERGPKVSAAMRQPQITISHGIVLRLAEGVTVMEMVSFGGAIYQSAPFDQLN